MMRSAYGKNNVRIVRTVAAFRTSRTIATAQSSIIQSPQVYLAGIYYN